MRPRRTSGVRPMVTALSTNQRGAVGAAWVMASLPVRSDAAAVGEVDAAVGGRRFCVQQSKVAPATGAGVLAGCDRRRARIAADARIALGVKRVYEQTVLGDVRGDVVAGPVV